MGVKTEALEFLVNLKKKSGKISPEDEARIDALMKERILVEEMDVNPSYAKQAADGDVSYSEAKLRSDNQNRRLGTGKEQESIDDISYVNSVRSAGSDNGKLQQWKSSLPEKQRAAVTDAEIEYKRGNPKPLAQLYRVMGASAVLGAGSALASEDAEAKPSLLLRKGIDAITAGRQIKNKINKEGGDPARVVQRFVHENTNYDSGFTSLARRWDQGRNGDAYVFGIKKMAYDLLQGTDDPQVRQAVMGWLTPRLQRAALPVAGIGMSQAALANPEVKDSGHISAPRSGMLNDITMGLRDVERRVRGSPAQVLVPEGLTQYLETVNRRTEDPNATTRMFAALDVIPF
jgi:hypothetical protein